MILKFTQDVETVKAAIAAMNLGIQDFVVRNICSINGYTYLEVLSIADGTLTEDFLDKFRPVTQNAFPATALAVLATACKTGAATVAANASSVAVTHGLGTTPTRVELCCTAPGTASYWWVNAKGATTFVINLNATPATAATFDWRAAAAENV